MHTKGKWEIGLPKHPDIRQKEDRLIYVRMGDKKLHIAEVYQYQNHNNREANGTAIANARLIVAAPDLLAACEAIFKLIDDGELVRNTKNDNSPTWALEQLGLVATLKDAQQAIAKAKQ